MFSELHGRRGVTFQVMGSRGRALWLLPILLPALGVGCGSKSTGVQSQLTADADFSVCATSPDAVHYAPGISVVSTSGNLRAAINAAATDQGGSAPVPTAAVGYDTFTVAITSVADGGAGSDAGTPAPDGLTLTTPPISPTGIPADPYMPVHKHGASTVPTITAQGGGLYSVAAIDFFMAGYWELYLDATPPGGAADPLTFKLCIPDD